MTSKNLDYLILGGVAAAAAALLYHHLTSKTSSNDNDNDKKSNVSIDTRPVKAPRSIIDTICNTAGPHAPEFLLELQNDLATTTFQLNLPLPNGFYVVGSGRHQREIFLDPTTDKPLDFIRIVDAVTSGPSIVTRSTFDSKWKHSRKAVDMAFSSAEVRRMNEVCQKVTQQWIDNFLDPLCESGDPIFDPSKEYLKVVCRAIIEAGFEYEIADDELDALMANMDTVLQEYLQKQGTNPFRRLVSLLLPEARKAKQCAANIYAFARKMLVAYRINPNKSEQNTLIKIIDNNSHYSSDDEKIADIIVLLLAGHDTTGYTLASTTVLLAKHTKEQDKVRKSLLQINKDMRQGDRIRPSEYMRYVITESMRYKPVSAFGPVRQTGRAFTLADPNRSCKVAVPKGAIVLLPQLLANHDPAVFDDPETFRPDRWHNATKEMIDTVMPFAVGCRNCAGQSLAKAELHSVLPKLLCRYKFELVEEGRMEFFMTWKYAGAKVRIKRI